ncbi:MAG: 3' terminal RNA ribose 2'-O-methyltransferase Hen1 [Planctomycetota bacterium]
MLLTISTTGEPSGDLGFLLHKHPDRVQEFELSFGRAIVYYPESSPGRCSACLLLDIDPVEMVRGRKRGEPSYLLGHYVNDRPYVASSLMSVAISQVFGTAMAGRCNDRPVLAETPIPLTATIDVLPVRGEAELVNRLFEPLGYRVATSRHRLDEQFLEWGESQYYSVSISAVVTLAQLLTHLYVLIPVFDNSKHYYVGEDELQKLLSKGGPWLGNHPERERITKRYLRHQPSLFRRALERLVEMDESMDQQELHSDGDEEVLERPISLNEQRHGTVLSALRASGATSVIDLGCGEGKLLRQLLRDRQFDRIVGVDVSIRALEIASKRLKLDRLPERQSMRMQLVHGSLMYRDDRFSGFDAASVVEVIEHLDPPRLAAFERVLFEFARPKTVVLTTPNQEYNVMWESLPAGEYRHPDHRFEWPRDTFQDWATGVANRFGYQVRFLPVGPEDDNVGSPTQMGVFTREGSIQHNESKVAQASA